MSRSPFTRTAFLTRQAERVTDVMLDLLLSIGEEVILGSDGKLSLEERAALIHMASVRVAATAWKAGHGTREMYLEMCETMWDSLPEPKTVWDSLPEPKIPIARPPNRELRQNLELARELNAKVPGGKPLGEAERAVVVGQIEEAAFDLDAQVRLDWESPGAR